MLHESIPSGALLLVTRAKSDCVNSFASVCFLAFLLDGYIIIRKSALGESHLRDSRPHSSRRLSRADKKSCGWDTFCDNASTLANGKKVLQHLVMAYSINSIRDELSGITITIYGSRRHGGEGEGMKVLLCIAQMLAREGLKLLVLLAAWTLNLRPWLSFYENLELKFEIISKTPEQ